MSGGTKEGFIAQKARDGEEHLASLGMTVCAVHDGEATRGKDFAGEGNSDINGTR
ncbi:MAG TPA: hypothetical protein VEI73_09695 [Candidatus Acidoferrum sp.]|nr:hypothetical protein [Candidatus Acidoferrum sp.]